MWDLQALMKEYGDLVTLWMVRNGMNILLAVIIFLFGWWFARHLGRLSAKWLNKYGIDPLQVGFISTLLRYSTVAAVLLIAADRVGINITSLIAVFGAAALAIGLAVKDNLSNFSSGMLLVFFRPFTAGDFVEVSDTSGTVQATNLFSTILHTLDNKKVFIPNRLVMDSIIVNYSGNDTRRIDLVIGIGYGDDISLAKKTILELLTFDEAVLEIPEPMVAVESLGDSSVNLTVRAWVSTGQYVSTKFRLLENIKLALDEQKISIPFPQMDVHLDRE